jgi:hypothetical protein
MNIKTNEYRISLCDQSAFLLTWLKRNWLGKTNRQRFLLYTGIICLLMLFGMAPSYSQLFSGAGDYFVLLAIFMALGLAIGSAIMAAIMVFVLGPILIFVWQTISYPFGLMPKRIQTVSLSDSGLTKYVGETSSLLEWPAIFHLVETRTILLFFTNANCAMIVPKNAFATPENADQFAKAAQAHYASAKSIF